MNIIIFYILGIALVYRVILLILKRKEEITSDARDYHLLALSLMKWKYHVPDTKLDQFRTPGYPFFISLIYRLFGTGQMPVFVIQIIINLASIYLTYLIGSMMFGQITGIFAAFVLCIDPDFIYHIFDILTETLFTFLLLLSIYLMLLFDRTGSIAYSILIGLTLAAMTYIKPGAGLLPVIYCLFLPFYEMIHLSFFYLAPLLLWMLRNYFEYGFFRLCSISGYNLLVYNVGEPKRDPHAYIYWKATLWTRINHGFEESDRNTKLAIKAIIKHQWEFIINQFKGIYRLLFGLTLQLFKNRFQPVEMGISKCPLTPTKRNIKRIMKSMQLFQLIYLCCLYLTGIAGAFKAGYDGLLLAGIILYFVLLPGGAGSARYRVPVIPLIVLFVINIII